MEQETAAVNLDTVAHGKERPGGDRDCGGGGIL